jgi:hypothetical protein
MARRPRIVAALQTGRYEVYVPRTMDLLFRAKALVPTAVADFVTRVIKGDRVLVNIDHATRAAYEARMARTISGGAGREG